MATTKHTIVGELLFAAIGVGAFAVVASSSEKIGKFLLVIMLGFFLIFFMVHGQDFANVLQRLQSLGTAQKGN